ncbi:phage portal protein [Sphingomonas melonis]|uniref:phage portal protein n=1 Tax=Sphingomonas melonis TaxID=152682 RepID=UPI0035C81478
MSRRSFTVEYASGVSEAERMRAETKDILPWRGGAASTENGSNFTTNQVTLASFDDARARGSKTTLGLSAVWACINLLAGTIASLPLMVYRTDRDGVRSVARNHSLYPLLHDAPNFDQTAVDYWEFQVGAIELQGNAYAVIDRRQDGSVIALRPIRPDVVKAQRTAGRLEYAWVEDGNRIVRPAKDVLHVRGPMGDALSGCSTLSICRGTFDAAASTDMAAAAIFANSVRPSGILSTDAAVSLTKDQRSDFEALLHEKFVGAMKSGRPMLLDRGMKWTQIDLNPEDAQMLETRRFSVEEICRIFGVPPHMVGHTENSTSWGTGLEQQTLGFVKFSLRRRLKRIEQALEQQLLTARDWAEGVTIEFNLEGLLRGDSAGRASFYQSGLSNGWMTINEVRRLENLPPVEGGDVPRMQSQNVPITAAGQPAEEGQ